ncbi:putative glycerophosphodiester phosphodiesterase, protein kinase RLK-Pelle-LRK10L-2 family [Helianthus annuus]|nr:putative glycerophosphodiester phosphodiesterase, protein kinase RLK-Pelle-LRK10L-2 family [Helianthus annuus]
MKPRPDPSPATLAITVVLATIISFPVARCQDTPYDICGQSVQCGEIEIVYPFWLSGRPQHCAHPDFQLSCRSDVPMIRLGPADYRVLKTDSSTHTVTVARNDLWETICPQLLYNTTYNTTLFNGNNFGREEVSLYYGCQGILGASPLAAGYRFSCDVNQTLSDSYFYRTSLINNDTTISSFLVQCNNHITVPVDQSWVNRILTATESDLRQALQDGFKLLWNARNDVCDQCVRSGGRCTQLHLTSLFATVLVGISRQLVTIFRLKAEEVLGGSKSSSLGIVLGIVGAVIAVVGIGCGIFVCRQRKKTRPIKEWVKVFYQNPSSPVSPKGPEAANNKIEIFIRNYGNLAPKRYKYSEIEKMTNSFQEKLGHGGYGSVYRGQLHDGHQVAVKLLSEATGDGEDFINEVASIGRTSHVNIVTLLGFCFEGKKRALLYKFMPNGSLDKFLRGDGSHLDWNTLFQIAKGIARGLEYLHKGCNTRIVHFDIKPHNILLDEEFVPKISDFGLAKLCKTKESIVSVMGARGTAGYMAPEVFFKSLGGASHKSDVYSYGMMVLEMTGARKHNNTSVNSTSEAYFPDWVCWLQAPNPTHSQHTLTNCL